MRARRNRRELPENFTPPPQHDEAAEQTMLGTILLCPEALATAATIVKPEDFYNPSHATVFQAFLRISDSKADPPTVLDAISVAHELRLMDRLNTVGGLPYLGHLTDHASSTVLVEQQARLIADFAAVRRMAFFAKELGAMCADPTMPFEEVARYAHEGATSVGAVVRGMQAVHVGADVEAIIADMMTAPPEGGLIGYETGLPGLNAMLGGLRGGKVYVIAARPAMGKSALAALMLFFACEYAKKTAIYLSLEMPSKELTLRLMCALARVDIDNVEQRTLTSEDCARLFAAGQRLAASKLKILDVPEATIADVKMLARAEAASKDGLCALGIDYLQLMRGAKDEQNREQEVASISRGVKMLAKALDIPVLLLSQLNRKLEDRPSKKPQLSDLRESGSVEQDSDVVLFIYRPDAYEPETTLHGLAELIIAKQRGGKTGSAWARFIRPCTLFTDITDNDRQKIEDAGNAPPPARGRKSKKTGGPAGQPSTSGPSYAQRTRGAAPPSNASDEPPEINPADEDFDG